jgi:gamma-glutamyltranspeptidase/glutathione hydrolase
LALLLPLVAAACTSGAPTQKELKASFVGGVVADEPRAALAGLAALKAGGTAADAAAATFFSLAVTYPLAAGLGGGGTCVTYDVVTGTSESIDFRPTEGALGGAVALPGAVRGIAALHARFGRLRWSQVVLPAEEMARFGFPTSRALATATAEYARTTGAGDLGPFIVAGRPVEEGQDVRVPGLAETLSGIRSKGGGDFYFGVLARDLIGAAQEAGGRLTIEDLKQFLPAWQRSARTPFGDLSLFTPASGPSGGTAAASMWAMLTEQGRFLQTPPSQRPHLIVETSHRALVDSVAGGDSSAFRAATLLSDYDPSRHVAVASQAPDLSPWIGAGRDGTTGLVALDAAGSAVACVLTMNAPFGQGRFNAPLGLFFAPPLPPGPGGWLRGGTDFTTPAIVANAVTGEFVIGATGTGGPAAPAATMSAISAAVLELSSLRQAVDRPRVVGFPEPDVAVFERGTPAEIANALQAAGHRLLDGGQFSIVNAILCFGGATLDPSGCQFVADGRGFGLGDGGIEF